MTGFSRTPLALPWPRGGGRAARSLPLLAGLALLCLAPASALGQSSFPVTAPTEFFTEGFEDGPTFYGNWTLEGDHALTFVDPSSVGSLACAVPGYWGSQTARDSVVSGGGVMLVNSSLPEGAFSEYDWTNFKMEVDFNLDDPGSQVGFAWALSADSGGSPAGRDDGYLLVIENPPRALDVGAGLRADWRLYKRTGDVMAEIANDVIEISPTAGTTIVRDTCYRLRLEWFCGNLRVSVRRFQYDSSSCSTGCFYGCDPPTSGGNCTATGSSDACWCTFIRWTDPTPLAAGAAGVYTGGGGGWNVDDYVDNFAAATWGLGCQICTDWSQWGTSWASGTGNEGAKDTLELKLLFEGGLVDQRLGIADIGLGRIDADVEEPTPDAGQTDGFCNGWRLLVDLPDPFGASGANAAAMRSFLEPIATAVKYQDDGDITTPDGAFTNDFENDPSNPNYNPIPLVASGTTPIATALKDAYEWYVTNMSPGGTWADDPLAACRYWYVVLITDGEESCYRHPDGSKWLDYACEPGQAGSDGDDSFAHPRDGIAPVKVHVVGFSAGADDTAISCVADHTNGNYYSAQNAAELSATLYDVVNEMLEEGRTFLPITVSPPPTQIGTSAGGDFLVLVPQYTPINRKSVWDGHLLAYQVNAANPLVPRDAGGNLDTGAAAWDGAQAIQDQVTTGTPVRNTFWPRYSGGAWDRVPLATVPGDATLRDEFRTMLDFPGVTDAQVQEIVEFVRDIGAGAASRTNYLGDIFHAAPVIVSPPNNFSYYFNNVHDYFTSFMQPNQFRRRVGVVGANDGLLHAFDAGVYDRDETNFNNLFDLGTGYELFSVLPLGVMSKLYEMTYGIEQQYMVDGGTVSADVFITPPSAADRQWRTVTVTALQQGGRSYVALDLTTPDPPDTYGPTTPADPACLDGTAPDCSGVYPRVMWEFTDTSDEDANCPGGLTGNQCAPYWDLGWTWSPPAVARVKLDNSSNPSGPDDLFVAFFGGGWDSYNYKRTAYSALTGNFFYGVNVETGEIVYKVGMPGSMIPGGVAALDSDNDGFVDRLYFGDTTGGLWRLDVTAGAVVDSGTGRVTNWTLHKLYQFPADQEFFTRPVVVPADFSGGAYTWALAIGSGDRANMTMEDGVENRFYFVLDVGDSTTRGESNLHEVNESGATPDPAVGETTTYLDPTNGVYGWFIHLRENEKVNADAIVAGEQVQFPTFTPTALEPDPLEPRCQAVGIGRLYAVWYNNANPVNDSGERGTDLGGGLIVGGTAYTIGDETVAEYTTWEGRMAELPIAFTREHVVTNWRQD